MCLDHGVCIETKKTGQGYLAKGSTQELEVVRVAWKVSELIRFAFQKEDWCQCWELDWKARPNSGPS